MRACLILCYEFWKLIIFSSIVRIVVSVLHFLLHKPKFVFRRLEKGVQEFHRKFVLATADMAAYNELVI